MKTFRVRICLALMTVLFASSVSAQNLDPTIRVGATVAVSDHVYMIPDENKPIIPNVGFVVGNRATLVIDTGLGEENGRIVLSEAIRLAPENKLYIASSHAHPEHDLGAMAFPKDATVIRSANQILDIKEMDMRLVRMFAGFSLRSAELLEGAYFRPADVIYTDSMRLDLGGVHVRIIEAGPNHTLGDTAFLVEEDELLFTGDVVMNEFPMPLNPRTTIQHWLDTLDMLQGLGAKTIVPCHYAVGSTELIENYRSYFTTVRDRANALADEGKSEEEAAEILKVELAEMFNTWKDPNRIPRTVSVVYRERK
ncbi:MAG: MBL fold metallo-hydrolase [Bacteroidota bacterium]